MVFSLFLAALLPIAVRAANDWSKPCFGECNYDITGAVSGTMRISGSQSAISDITKAAGWVILNCDANSTAQDIRAVCNDPSAGCENLYQNGAAGTIVRLPQDCGATPFARVAKEWVHQDQSIPASMQAVIRRRDGTTPLVKGIRLDTSFHAVDPSQNGNVTIFVQGTSIAGAAGNATVIAPSKRGLFGDVKGALENFASFDKNISATSPLQFSHSVNLFNTSINCPQNGLVPGFGGSVSVDLQPSINATVTYGVAANGSLIPPSIDSFGLFARLDGTLDGTLSLDTDLVGTIGTGQIPIFTVGIPGLDFPGIFSVGPTFTVNVEADATLDTNINLAVDLAYTMSNAELFFPPSSSPSASGGSFVPGDSNLKLSVSPNVTSHGTLTAHLIPTVAFGVSVIDGLADVTINLDLDASASLDLSLQAVASAGVATNANGTSTSTEFGGCVDVQTGLSVNAGADGSFFKLFDASTTISLFSKTFDLFKKCFGSTPARRAYTGRKARAALLAKRLAISCPSFGSSTAASVVDETVKGSSLT